MRCGSAHTRIEERYYSIFRRGIGGSTALRREASALLSFGTRFPLFSRVVLDINDGERVDIAVGGGQNRDRKILADALGFFRLFFTVSFTWAGVFIGPAERLHTFVFLSGLIGLCH
jgi:hypothetical protein